ncbi:hypothetical protein BDA99DRAFT_556192 [Phascolomyces articulosus]|uniref:UspA domain-containing protein n=1 Tax=Phascolomyces articulosus TaxID=60185 RepID=A0AAD5K939_9FUNG|nr:hypothetical protein BDA99DRAFT_556192 [Phascolomyces articulosus]
MSTAATAEFAAALGFPLTTEEPTTPGLEEKVNELNLIKAEDQAIEEAIIEPKPEPNRSSVDDVEVEDDNDDNMDEELFRITESNRHIPHVDPIFRQRTASMRRRKHLVFSDPPHTERSVRGDRIMVTSHYGVVNEKQCKRRAYLAACDFSEESLYALEWVMGTMMRDGDTLYVLTVVNREDNPDAVKATGLTKAKELEKASEALTRESRKILNQMLLFDIVLITCTVAGRVKDILASQIQELPLTMVVCGSKGRGTVKGLLMGSISTFLVHNSTVPVSVIRQHASKKRSKKKSTKVPPLPLSESVKTGKIAVDELSKTK